MAGPQYATRAHNAGGLQDGAWPHLAVGPQYAAGLNYAAVPQFAARPQYVPPPQSASKIDKLYRENMNKRKH